MYPPVMAPQANMFGNVPGYEGTVPGGGKKSPVHIIPHINAVAGT